MAAQIYKIRAIYIKIHITLYLFVSNIYSINDNTFILIIIYFMNIIYRYVISEDQL